MPVVSRFFLRSGFVCLALALLLRMWIFSGWSDRAISFMPVFYHLLTVGWATQIIFGVAHWMFPRYSQERPRGHESLTWIVYVCLNSGLLLRLICEPYSENFFAVIGLGFSAALQFFAAAIFSGQIWLRVR